MDAENPNITPSIATDMVDTSALASAAAAGVAAQFAMQVAALLPGSDGQLVLPNGVSLNDIRVVGRDLVVRMPDGSDVVIPDGAIIVPQFVINGVAVPSANLAALLIGQEPQPAAGPPQSSGGNFFQTPGDIGDPFALGDLLPPTQLAFPEPREREIIPNQPDEEPTTIIITPDQPAGSVNATASVNEAGLPARGTEPPGSNEAANSETTTGSIVFDAPDGLGSITLNGVAITAVGQVFTTPLGRLTITSIAPGNIDYSYTLTDNSLAANPADIFDVVVTDRDGDSATAELTISIIDDAPTARNDTDSVPAADFTGQTGNVITGAGTTSGAAGADTQGADGAAVTGFRAGTATGAFSAAGATISGQYGTLTLGANGSYTYTRNANTPGGVNDVFTYQITDGDGDTSTATLTISIGDSPATVLSVPLTGGGTIVDEEGLPPRGTEPPGSNPESTVETTSGVVTFTAPDGVASVQVNGVTITGPGQVINTPTGTFLVTSYDPVVGTLGYTFTLTDNTTGDSVTQVLTVTVTDLDGDSDTEPFTITVIDDEPTARNDSGTQTAENAAITVNVITNDTQGADGVSLTSGVAVVPGTLSGTGSLAYDSNGSFTYTPGAGEEGVVTFQYQITDGDGDQSTATVTITLLADSTPRIAIEGDREVEESGLPARGAEPEGSNAASNGEVASGTLAVTTGNDSIGSLVINGVNVTNGGSVTGASGTLVVTRSGSTYSYTYTLTDNTSGDATTDSFAVVVTDSDGDSANDTLVIAIVDDRPTAANDSDSIASGQYGPATGNVISDAEGDGGRDTQGADGVVVSAVTGTAAGTVGGATAGQYGVLTLNADGSYSYVRNAGTPGGVSDVFSYTIRDGDGDASTATLTISIADSPTSLDLPTEGEAGTEVNEAGLPAGSDAASNSETTAGTIAYTAPDGPATITIDGVAVTAVGQSFTGNFGTLTITSIANGTIGYSYTLTTNTSGDNTFDDFAVVVTDQDGDNTPGTLVIDIIDDVPTARPDVDSVTEDDFVNFEGNPQADGNVLTGIGGVDANATDGVADTQGADGATVTGVRFGATSGSVGTGLSGAYGELTLNADGSYSYVLDNFNPAVQGLDSNDTLTEIFTYDITDGDGDLRTTTLTITINGSDDPIVISGLNLQAPELIVDEDDLSDGSSPNAAALTQTGSFTVNGTDGISSIRIEGTEAFVGQVFTTAYGSFTITAISAPANGSSTSIVVGYSYTLTDNTAHPNANGQNFLTEVFDIDVTDTDGSTDSATIEVQIIDDVPTAADDTDTIAGGSNAPATGNVITDAEGDGGADTRGADGATVTAITGTAAGTVGGTTAGQHGVLTLNSDGSYSYVRNSGSPGNVTDTFTYTITDGDGDTSTATLTITIEDDRPVVGANPTVVVDDDAQPGGNAAPNATDDFDPVNVTGTLSGAGGDGALTWAFQTNGAPAGFTYTPNGTTLEVRQGATLVLTITLDSATGAYTVTQNAPILHANADNENNTLFTINYTVSDIDLDSTPGTLTINVDDDVPTAVNDALQSVAEDAANIGGNLLANDAQGADGAVVTHINLGSGFVAISSGTPVAGGAFQFATANGVYTIAANGAWTFNPNSGLNNASGVDASFSYRITDADGDPSEAVQPITITDGAGPVAGPPITLELDDQNLSDGSTPAGPDSDADSITFTAGSDAIASIVFGTDLSSLGGGLTWVRTNANTIVGSDGATPIVTLTLSVVGNVATVTATLNNNYDSHPTFTADDLVNLGSVGVVATDIDGDIATGTVNVTVSDDVPTAVSEPPFVIPEDAPAVGGLLLNNDTQGADGATVTHINLGSGFVAINSGIPVAGGAFQFTTANGVYTIAPNGAWTFDPNTNLNNASGIPADFSYRLTDADGDISEATQGILILDGAVPVAGPPVTLDLDDQNLSDGSTPAGPDSDADSITFTPGSDAFTSIVFAGSVATLGGGLSWVRVNDSTIVGSDGATPVVTLTLAVVGNVATVTATLNNNYDSHPSFTADDLANLGSIGVVATDTDGDTAIGTVNVRVSDDVPTAVADGAQSVAEDGANISGNVLTNDTQGADGASVTHINLGSGFVAINTGTPVAGGAFQFSTANGVYTIAPDGAWTFNPNGNLSNAADINAGFSYRITDADNDISEAVQPITVTDGANPLATRNAVITVDEEGIGTANATGSNAGANSENGQDTVSFTAGSDNITAIAFGAIAGLTADVNGVPGADIVWTRVSDTQITGAIGGMTAITINLTPPALPILAGASGSATVAVILSDNFPHPNAAGENVITLSGLNVVATDTDGDPASATVTINVTDDVPTANADTDAVTEDGPTVANGNVLTAAAVATPDANSTDGVADVQGADGATVTGVVFGTPAGPVSGNVGAIVNGTYGTLTLAAGGGYTYTLNNGLPAVQSLSAGQTLIETFTYTITDGDGDGSTTTLQITINGADDGVTITGLGSNAEETVFENDLSDGSSPDAPALTQTGSFAVTAVDGLANVVIGGVTVVSAGVLTGTLTVDTPLGLLTITGFTPTLGAGGEVIGGTINYSYLLQDNSTAHASGAGANGGVFDNFNVIVTDVDGSTNNAVLNVEIIDDVPTANNDTIGQLSENATVTFSVFGNDVFGADGVDTTDVTPPAGVTFTQPPAGQGSVTYNPATGQFTFTPAAGQQGSTSFTYTIIDADGDPSTATVTVNLVADSVPIVTIATANVDDDGLTGNNPASTIGDIDANSGEVPLSASEAVYNGTIAVNYGNDSGTISFAALSETTASLGTETISYGWNAGTNTLTATTVGGTRPGTPVFQVQVTNPATGAYTVTLLDNVLHAAGGNETSASLNLGFIASDSDGDTAPGTLTINFNDDAPSLGTIQNGAANNLPASAVSTGTLFFAAGADGIGTIGIITANTTGITSGGRNIVTNQVGNVLTGYADVDGSGTFNTGDTAVFTLTVNPAAGTSGQYIFDLIAPLDGTIVNTPIGGSSSFGAGPTQLQVLSNIGGTSPLAVVSGYDATGAFNSNAWFNTSGASLPAGLTLSSVNGSTAGWGVDNNNLDDDEFMRFDFGDTPALDDFDGAGPYVPPAVNLPEISFATFEFTNFTAADVLRVRIHFTDGTSAIQTVTGASLATQVTFTAPAGRFIDWIDIFGQTVGSGGGKVDLVSVGVQSTVVNVTLGFNVTLTDGDGDAVSGGFTVNVADGNTPSGAVSQAPLKVIGGDPVQRAIDSDSDTSIANAVARTAANDDQRSAAAGPSGLASSMIAAGLVAAFAEANIPAETSPARAIGDSGATATASMQATAAIDNDGNQDAMINRIAANDDLEANSGQFAARYASFDMADDIANTGFDASEAGRHESLIADLLAPTEVAHNLFQPAPFSIGAAVDTASEALLIAQQGDGFAKASVQEVISDALAGGVGEGPNVDALLDALAGPSAQPLLGDVLAGDAVFAPLAAPTHDMLNQLASTHMELSAATGHA
jgi:large repetitive protein